MRKFLWFGGSDEPADQLLQSVAKDKRPVLAEIEHQNLRLRSMLAIRGRKVVLGRPRELPRQIPRGGWIRLYHPRLPELGFRLQVLSPHFRLTNGNSAVIAELPTETVGASARAVERYDTSRYVGLRLAIPASGRIFAVEDISLRGCRVHLESGWPPEVLPRDQPITGALLAVGRQRVSLLSVTPRVHFEKSVGCEIEVPTSGQSARLFRHFLARLEKEDKDRGRIDPTV